MFYRVLKVTCFFFSILLFNLLAAESIQDKAVKKAETFNWRCEEHTQSIQEHVFKARLYVKREKFRHAARAYKTHLSCWEDTKIYIELGEMYQRIGEYYNAKIAYNRAGSLEKLDQLKKVIQSRINDSTKENFRFNAELLRLKHYKRHSTLKEFSYITLILGSVAASVGTGLFIHDIAGGKNSLSAQYSTLLGGMALINVGLLSSHLSEYNLNVSKVYNSIASNSEFVFMKPYDHYKASGGPSKARKASAKTMKKNGICMLLVSLPMTVLSIYSFFDSYDYIHDEKYDPCDSGDSQSMAMSFDTMGLHMLQMILLIPSLGSFIGGIIMIAKANSWSKLNAGETLFTLSRISPIINPISKTYGVSMGFSF